MFLGEYTHTVDEKGRLTIPAKFRNALAQGLVVTRGLDRNLVIYPQSEFSDLAERVMAKPMTDKGVRAFRRRVFSGAIDLEADRQGRILLPPYLREFAGIESEVVVVGNYNYIEIWSTGDWEAARDSMESDESAWEDLGI
ncbi:MAG: division/cell wall cluster transcriptional repressor MraZ [Anaerolineales bacterium]|nr:division/cell wall cluster transcriptional repressor MraZ [Anaerolineales bacterium]MCB8961664.1 division/cell wall cluster transcriptional repressor MraZ [Ardenticatenales bacterium]